ncbi:MAG: ABC transporter ATP-binding protein [Pseudomonadota bacterium]
METTEDDGAPTGEAGIIAAYRRLWRTWLYPHRARLSLALFVMALSAASAAGYAKFTQVIMQAFDEGAQDILVWAPVGVIALTVLKSVTQYLRLTLTNSVLAAVEADMQVAMYRTLVSADLARHQEEAPAALAARFTADVTVIRVAVQNIMNGISFILIILATVATMLTIDWVMTLGLVAIFGLALIPITVIGTRIRRIARLTQREIGSMTAEVSEGLSGIRLAKTYRLEGHLAKNAAASFERLRELKIKALNWRARIEPIIEGLSGTAVAALLIFLGWRLTSGAASIADFAGLLTGLAVMATPAQRLGNVYAGVMQGLAALERVYALFDTPDQVVERPDAVALAPIAREIRFRGVDFAYPDGAVALRDFDLRIPAGARVALVGRSGAGKSTVFNLIPRLYDVTAGALLIDDVDVRQATLASLREQIALVSQDSVLLSATVAENIAFGRPGADRAEIGEAARAAAAHDFIAALPEGYDTPVAPAAMTFSGGERQRLSIARAILRDAPILLLDEPTSALDAGNEAMIRTALDRLSAGRTTLVIAHRLATILDADMIVAMDRGHIVEVGTHGELLARGGLYAELYHLQFRGEAPRATG